MSENNLRAVIEAILFSSDRPVPLEQIRNVLDDLDPSQIRKEIEELGRQLEQDNRGMRVIEIAGGFQMISAPGFAPFLKRLYKQRHVERLSRPALETLAIIAYKQPLTRMEIEALRNVNVDGLMRSLLDKDLIRVVGRKKAPGRPKVFGTTKHFLEYFGLKSLEELPKMEDFSALANSKEAAKEAEDAPGEVTPTN